MKQLPPDVAFVFASSLFAEQLEQVVPHLRRKVPSLQHVMGSTGFGVIGGSADGPREVEQAAAVSITLLHLAGTRVATRHIMDNDIPDLDSSPAAWQDLVGEQIDSLDNGAIILMADPTFMRVTDLLQGLDFSFPHATKIGGLSSAALSDSGRRGLLAWSKDCASSATNGSSPHGVYSEGCVLMTVWGDVAVEPIIAQGCRPLTSAGPVYNIEQCVNNIVMEVTDQDGVRRPVIQALSNELATLSDDEKRKAGKNIMVGLAPDSFKPTVELGPQDFLIRQIIGLIPAQGALAVGDLVRSGQRFKFMVRDREGALHDMQEQAVDFKRRQLQSTLEAAPPAPPIGALLFSCNGRGQGLYGQLGVDSQVLTSFVPVPAAGFFCNGEIGSVSGTTYLHGFTCAAAIFRDAPLQEPMSGVQVWGSLQQPETGANEGQQQQEQ